MRILWNSETAQELLKRLDKAKDRLDECLNQTRNARQALSEANADGDDRVLIKAGNRLAACEKQMDAFSESLDEFIDAIRRTDGMFEETEADIARMAIGEANVPYRSPSAASSGGWYANWEPAAFVMMPDMRIRTVEIPEWLEAITKNNELISSM
ncbi:MAG: hypothetical protein IJC48_06125 [Clostridia bacterium]|nr:hypothetical protein [Clostridia bacterium]MBQ4159002.1 hypothetical protein [Clostridia bacterium]